MDNIQFFPLLWQYFSVTKFKSILPSTNSSARMEITNGSGLTVSISGSLNSATAWTCISITPSLYYSKFGQFWILQQHIFPHLQNFIINQQSLHSTLLFCFYYPRAILNHGSFSKIHITADTFQGIINVSFTTLCKAFWIHQISLFKTLKW